MDSGKFYGTHHPIKYGDVQIPLKLCGELGKARAAQQDRFRVIFVFGLPRFGVQHLQRPALLNGLGQAALQWGSDKSTYR